MQTLLAQLTLSLSSKDEATFANYYAGKNAEIVAELKKMASGAGERMMYLCGTRGQGCSHLLQACCHDAHQHGLTSVYLPLANLITAPCSEAIMRSRLNKPASSMAVSSF